jgi:hypothetical protein
MSECCNLNVARKPGGRMDIAGWIATAALYMAIPKCPACLAGYVAVWTGIGLSFGAAEVLRQALLAICAVVVVALLFRKRLASIAWKSK